MHCILVGLVADQRYDKLINKFFLLIARECIRKRDLVFAIDCAIGTSIILFRFPKKTTRLAPTSAGCRTLCRLPEFGLTAYVRAGAALLIN